MNTALRNLPVNRKKVVAETLAGDPQRMIVMASLRRKQVHVPVVLIINVIRASDAFYES